MASGDVPAEAELGDFDLLIVDGFNALGSRPDGWWRDRPAAMEALVAELGTLARERPGLEIEVCFDGRRHERVGSAAARVGIGVSFAGPGPDAADRMIAARVRERSAEARVLVASSDRRLAAAVKAAGGSSVGAGAFVRRHLAH